MIQRDYIQENRYDMGTAGTLTFNLDYSDPITEISLLVEATNGATSNKNNPLEMNISKIEIVDGGEVLWSAPGVVAFSAWCQLNAGLPHCYRSGAGSDSPWTPINLLFGRYLYDREYAFNPIAHRNPQLKITFDEASVRAASATAYSTGTFNLSIMVKLMEDLGTLPKGFLSLRDIESFSSASAGDRKVEMPTDRVIRFLTTRVYESGTHMENHITRYKLSADGARRVFFDLLYRNMRDKCAEYVKPIEMPQYTVTTDGEWHQSWMGDGFTAYIRAHTASRIATAASHSGGRFKVSLRTEAGAAAVGPVHFAVRGFPLHQMFIYPFGRLNQVDDWMDARVYNKLDYILTQENELATVQVGLQQVYPY